MRDTFPDRRWVLWLAAGFEGGLAVLALLLGWLLDRPALETLKWSARDAALGVAACLPLVVVFSALVHSPLPPLRRIWALFDDVIRPLFAPCTLLDLAVISLLAGVGEELLFRGVIQPLLAGWLGAAAGLVVAGALFGLLHAITPTYVVIAALFGTYLGWLWEVTGNLLVAVVAHALYDFLVLVYLLRLNPNPPPELGPGERHD